MDLSSLLAPPDIPAWQAWIIIGTLLLSGVVKGATGAGAPIIAVPVMAAVVDVRFAILTMLMPNLLTNIWQAYHFRAAQPEKSFLWPYMAAGAAGIVAGTVLLARLSLEGLSLIIGLSIVAYIAFRLARPSWTLPLDIARRFAVPAGFAGGLLQGSTGLSAPATMTFLNAMRLPKLTFVATVSLLFVMFSVTHLLALAAGGLLGLQAVVLSLLAIVPIALGMTLGTRLLRVVSARVFDWLVLGLLSIVALRIFYEAAAGLL